ncbi:2-phospho-L-lactate transferase [uncultured Bradyrhizobium sp.]|uniref:2-phospho-L-lactate transferase n=1 Tax=uncultured Bradyrhizobium sp. TaxID=199684 RepID=UPI00262103C3|nr:2-phospho-L-lactate transferase [uncultured Bradyrhizobium sp.]
MNQGDKKIVALCGGVGGAKLAYGLNRLLGAKLSVVVNTGDDFEHLGLSVSPDLDTVIYTLGELADEERGWGRAGESWNFMDALGGLGGETWFRLGDRDLALHVLRSRALRAGVSLTDFTRELAQRLNIAAAILPMSDDPFATMIVTADERMSFQRYFVGAQAQPVVKRIEFDNPGKGTATNAVLQSIGNADAIILCPSNPYLSIDPILAVPGLLPALETVKAPIVAVSPLVGGRAIKGPTAKIMSELGVETSCASIVRHYPFLDGFVMDQVDQSDAARIEIPVHLTDTIMRSKDERIRLAEACLKLLEQFDR